MMASIPVLAVEAIDAITAAFGWRWIAARQAAACPRLPARNTAAHETVPASAQRAASLVASRPGSDRDSRYS